MKQVTVVLQGTTYTVEVVTRKKMKNLRMRILSSDTLRVSKSPYVSLKKALDFIQERETWVCESSRELATCKKVELTQPYQIVKSLVRIQVQPLIEDYCLKVGVPMPRIVIRKYSSQWGRCSSRKEIALNILLHYVPAHLIEYVVLHEVCHLVHMNHSSDFWKLVKFHMPDYKQRKKEIQTYLLH